MKQQYISAGTVYNTTENHIPAPIFRKKFDYSGKTARMEITCTGFYRVFLNGVEFTKGWLAPYISNPSQLILFDEYDVSCLLKEKDNELLVVLGNGFTNSIDGGVWNFETAEYRANPKFYLGIFDGENRVVTTDETFEVFDSAITYDDYRTGEWYDATKEASVYDNARKPVLVDTPKGEYVKCTVEPIKTRKILKAKRIIPCKDGYIYDFGEDNAGVCKLNITAKAGQRIDIRTGEVVRDGDLFIKNLIFEGRTNEEYFQHDVYICKDGKQSYTPSFTYHGFQYAKVTGVTKEQATEDLLEFIVFGTEVKMHGSFACSNEDVNRLQECAVRSDLSNFHYFPTDCPQREKNGWAGDIALSAEQMFYNFEANASFKMWLKSMRNAQKESGTVPCICPTDTWGYAWGAGMGWDTVIATLPHNMYRFFGDKEVIEENLPMIEKYLPFMETKFNEDGLITFGLGDWCEAGNPDPEHGYTPTEVSDTLLCIDFLQNVVELYETVGKKEQAEKVLARKNKLVADFRKKHVTKDGWISCKTQCGQTFGIRFNVFTEEEKPLAFQNLLQAIHEKGDTMSVGALGGKYLFDVLSEFGETEFALKVLLAPKYPSFANWLKRGATTLWEGFQDYTDNLDKLERKDGSDYFLSFNHHFWGTVSAWFYRYLAGIKVFATDKIEISPDFKCGLDWAKADFENGENSVSVAWEKKENGFMLTVENKGFDCFVKAVGKKVGNGTYRFFIA